MATFSRATSSAATDDSIDVATVESLSALMLALTGDRQTAGVSETLDVDVAAQVAVAVADVAVVVAEDEFGVFSGFSERKGSLANIWPQSATFCFATPAWAAPVARCRLRPQKPNRTRELRKRRKFDARGFGSRNLAAVSCLGPSKIRTDVHRASVELVTSV